MNGLRVLRDIAREMLPSTDCRVMHEINGDSGYGMLVCSGRTCFECCSSALSKVADMIDREIRDLESRAIQDGFEWPRFEDGKKVMIGDHVLVFDEAHCVKSIDVKSGSFCLRNRDGGIVFRGRRGERVKPPIYKVAGKISGDCLVLDHLSETNIRRDSWDRIEHDVAIDSREYCDRYGVSEPHMHCGKAKCADLVRRARKLAVAESDR